MSQNPLATPAPGTANRRDFLRSAGFGILATSAALQACDSGYTEPEVPANSSVFGTVLNPDGEPVEGATVTLSGGPGGTFTAETNSVGLYSFQDIPPGTYTATLAAIASGVPAFGFDEQSAEVTVVEGGTGFTQNFNYGSTLDTVTFDFSSDTGVLNFAYALEQLEAAFYATVIGSAAFETTFEDEGERQALRDLAAHEAIHRDFLRVALGSAAIPDLLPDFEDIDFESRDSVLTTAQVFEDLGVGAYNGAGQFLSDPDLLTIAGKIVSVEARHASVISGFIEGGSIAGESVIDSDGLDRALAPSAVISAADPFIFNTISVSNVPSIA